MPVAKIYFVLGCSKPAAMVSRVPKINVVSSLYFYYELHIEDEYHHAVMEWNVLATIIHNSWCSVSDITVHESKSYEFWFHKM